MSMYHPLHKATRGVQPHVLTCLRNGPVFLHQDLSICSTCSWKARNVIIHLCHVLALLMLNLPLLSFLPSSTQYFCISTTQLFARNSWKTLPLQFMWRKQPRNFDLNKLLSDYTLSNVSLNSAPLPMFATFQVLILFHIIFGYADYYPGHDNDATYHNSNISTFSTRSVQSNC